MKYSRLKNFFIVSMKISSILNSNILWVIIFIIRHRMDLRFWRNIELKLKRASTITPKEDNLGGWIDKDTVSIIYAIIRISKPEVIIETGIGPGMSSASILKAIYDNNFGHLYSIDLPEYDKEYYPKIGKQFNRHIPPGENVGWLVDKNLSKNWEILIGDSKIILPELVKKVKNIDLFLHDSLHTDEHIKFEFETIKNSCNYETIYLCDDVNAYWSLVFNEIAEEMNLRFFIYRGRLGIGRN